MQAIDPVTFTLRETAIPQPDFGEVLIRVRAAGVNRADLLQRAGHYPPPPGSSAILGLEVAGTVVAIEPDRRPSSQLTEHGLTVGDEVIALVEGGGYAQYVTAPANQCLLLPPALTMTQGAALPEALATSWLNLVELAGLYAGESVLIHGGSGGIGSHAIQLAAHLGAHVTTTAGSAEKCRSCLTLGAGNAINYHDEDAAEQLRAAAGTTGFDVILDILGAGGLTSNLKLAAPDARIVIIGLQLGTRAELNLATVVTKRLRLQGSTLRALPPVRKAQIMASIAPVITKIAPQIHTTLPLAEVAQAHQLLNSAETFGKIILQV